MSNSKVLFQELIKGIQIPLEKEELQSIVYMILEHELGVRRLDVMAAKEIAPYDKAKTDKIISRINNYEPIQYILGEADFWGRKFIVNPSVLIPRPETEQLISEVLKFNLPTHAKILDIGTGSGCIAVTIALEISNSQVTATDISDKALLAAKQNAGLQKASVQFLKHDILTEDIPNENFDVIVSNPPYISSEEKKYMFKNVLDYEPHLALFSENDPLLFYRQISRKAKKTLKQGGKVVVEINEHFGKECLSIFYAAGFPHSTIVKDLQNKDRIIIAY